MKLTLGQAAKELGCSKPTLSRAIKHGRLSAERRSDTSYAIDPAELHRYAESAGQRLAVNRNDNPEETPAVQQSKTPDEIALLQVRLEALQAELDRTNTERQRERSESRDVIEDLRRRLDDEASERRKLTGLLTDQSNTEQKSSRLWWQFWKP